MTGKNRMPKILLRMSRLMHLTILALQAVNVSLPWASNFVSCPIIYFAVLLDEPVAAAFRNQDHLTCHVGGEQIWLPD